MNLRFMNPEFALYLYADRSSTYLIERGEASSLPCLKFGKSSQVDDCPLQNSPLLLFIATRPITRVN